MTPLTCYGGFTPRRPTKQELDEAFLWAVERQVTKTATVSLLANRYEVDQALCGRRVELRFDPDDLEVIEVYYAGRSFGRALVHEVGRHVHPNRRSRPTCLGLRAGSTICGAGKSRSNAESRAHPDHIDAGRPTNSCRCGPGNLG